MGMDLRDWEKESVPATGKEWRSICAGKVVSAGRGRQTGGGGVCMQGLQVVMGTHESGMPSRYMQERNM